MQIEQAEPGGGQLDESQVFADRVIVVGIESEADVEVLGAVDVGDGNGDQFELDVHDVPSCDGEFRRQVQCCGYCGQKRSSFGVRMKLSEFLVAPRVLLSLLDRSRTRSGYPPDSAALTHSVERAAHADALGYHRFWVAEHHAVPGIGSGSPAVLLAAIGAHTRDIRLGSGGVMLPNHQPLIVAEQFLMLEALYPGGRIDLGLGRSLGFTEPVRQALRRSKDAPDTFVSDLDEVRRYLDGSAAVTARPASQTGGADLRAGDAHRSESGSAAGASGGRGWADTGNR